jgi:hypothetical protein
LRSSQATHAAVDNSASIQPARDLFISWGKTVQKRGHFSCKYLISLKKPENFWREVWNFSDPVLHRTFHKTDKLFVTHTITVYLETTVRLEILPKGLIISTRKT